MKKNILLIALLLSALFIQAQAPTPRNTMTTQPNDAEVVTKSSLQLNINSCSPDQTQRINDYISHQRGKRGVFAATLGKALLSTVASSSSNILITEIIKATQIRKNQKEEWDRMIRNECRYVDSLTYIDNLTDFYSEGSFNGALDPSDLRFNGFTLNAQRDGHDVLKFYCHVATDTAGLCEIYNHSKFRLVLDSMYFYPYRCHLPNLSANHIYPEKGKHYDRNIHFSFDDRENLIVNLKFTLSSSWYNEAIILAQDVELGSFNVQIPIDKSHMMDSIFVYKRDMPGVKPLNISGDCFLMPRSYMPLPGGVAHWGTGEYNVKVIVSEQCGISKSIQDNWKKDYKCMKKMKKEKKVESYFLNLYEQNGSTVIRNLLETTSKTALNAAGLSGGETSTRMNSGGAPGIPNGGKP